MLRKLSLIAALTAALVLPAAAAGRGGFGCGGHIGGMGVGRGAGVWHFHSGGQTGGGAWHWHGGGYRGYPNYWYGSGGGYDDSSCWGWDPYSNDWTWICD